MKKATEKLLKDKEVTAILVGFIFGVGILALPNGVAKDAKQDGWISIIVGGMYPLILSLLAIYFCEKHPNEDILALSKKYLGEVIGTVCNILFMLQFVTYIVAVASGLSNVLRVYATPFLIQIKIFIVAICLASFLAYKGLKILAKINIITLYLSILLSATLISALKGGNYLNILPIFGAGYKNIFKASIESAYAFGGLEAIFLIYPYMENKKKITVVTLKATFISTAIYIWVTFLSVFFLGYKVLEKTVWAVLLLTESIDLTIFNSFRYLFLLMWSIIVIKGIANEYYATMYILKDTLKYKNDKIIYYITIPIMVYLSTKMGNEVNRREILSFIIPKITLLNIAYITVICLFIFVNDVRKKHLNNI